MSLTRTRLLQSDLLEVRHVHCRPTHACAGDVEEVERDILVLPLRGVYRMHLSQNEDFLAEATQAVFLAARRPYRVSHPAGKGDDCLALEFHPEVMQEALETTSQVDRMGELPPHATLPPPALAERALLRRRLSAGDSDHLEVEGIGMDLLATALQATGRERSARQPRERTIREWRGQSEVVRTLLMIHPRKRWTLRELAHHAYASPFHLARLFRWTTGVSVHEFQLRARITHGLDLLLDTDREIGVIALDLGFASHSHFSAAFRRAVGVSPSTFRSQANGAQHQALRASLVGQLRRGITSPRGAAARTLSEVERE